MDEYPTPYNEWLYETYFNYCLSNNYISKIYELLRIENKYNKENLQKLLDEYVSLKGKSLSKSYLANIRDLQLRILL